MNWKALAIFFITPTMNQQANSQTSRQADNQTDKRADKQTTRRANKRPTSGQPDERTNHKNTDNEYYYDLLRYHRRNGSSFIENIHGPLIAKTTNIFFVISL